MNDEDIKLMVDDLVRRLTVKNYGTSIFFIADGIPPSDDVIDYDTFTFTTNIDTEIGKKVLYGYFKQKILEGEQ